MRDNRHLSAQYNGESARIGYIKLPRELYDFYLEYYLLAREASKQAENTILDAQHQYAMASGRWHYTNMPDEQIFFNRVLEFSDKIKNHKAYFRASKYQDIANRVVPLEYVYITPQQAQEFYELLCLGEALFKDTVKGVWHTDYLKNMTRLKDAGTPYSGETCLQEMVDMAVGAYRIRVVKENMIAEGLILPSWKALINSPKP